jgi:2-polyprenyl-6-methoxyphenol hydroxylase-like FAD-dependent oxidoreductase
VDRPGPKATFNRRQRKTRRNIEARQSPFALADYHQVHRGDLLAALADAVFRNDPDCVFLEHCFETLTQDQEKILAKFSNGSATTSDVLIGCDGSTSKVRADVFGDKAVNYTGQIAQPPATALSVASSIDHERDCHQS